MKKWIVPILFGVAIVALIFLGIRAAANDNNDAKPDPSETPIAVSESDKAGLKEGQIVGQTNNPKVVVTEFGDFQCPACKAYEPTVTKIRNDYKDQVQLVFKHYPLTPTPHKNAQVAAYASEAASNQGKFWEMHDKLYATQDDWAELSNPKDKFVGYASDLGLDVDKFKREYDSEAGKSNISRDKDLGTKLKLKGTPSFYINGVAYEGTGGPEDILKQIDALVKQ